MSDQTIALQLNIDTNAPDTIDEVKQKIEDLKNQMSDLSPTDDMSAQFSKFGDTATNALKGIGVAATLASQNNADLANIIDKATDTASKAGSQKLVELQKNNALALKETEDFEKSDLDIKSKYQVAELSGLEQNSQEKKKILDSEFANAKSGADALSSLADLMVENGKKNTDAQKATALIQIGIDTAKAISSLVAASNENPANAATSGVAGIIQFTAGIAEILANVAKAKDILDGGSTSSSGSAPSLSAASAGINTNAPNLSNPQQTNATIIARNTIGNTSQQGTIKAYVVESEITTAQKRAATLKNQSMH